MCTFETRGVVKKTHTTRQQMCEQAKKRVEGNNTVQKLAPLCASSSPVSSRFLDMLHSGPHWAAGWPGSTRFFSSFSSSSFSSLAVANACTCLISQRDCDLWECFGMKRCLISCWQKTRMPSVHIISHIDTNFFVCLFVYSSVTVQSLNPWTERPWECTEEI